RLSGRIETPFENAPDRTLWNRPGCASHRLPDGRSYAECPCRARGDTDWRHNRRVTANRRQARATGAVPSEKVFERLGAIDRRGICNGEPGILRGTDGDSRFYFGRSERRL